MSVRRRIDGKNFHIIDAFPNRSGAKDSAKDYRESSGQKTRVVDMGAGAGRLRYGVFTTGSYGDAIKVKKSERGNIVKKRR